MVKLRLSRFGRKNQPTYRLVAIQARDKRQGEALEYLGSYNPRTKPSSFTCDKERVQYWLSVGAQPTDTVKYLLGKEGIIEVEKKTYQSKPGRK
jgi:small subunit ribosomal protein S16